MAALHGYKSPLSAAIVCPHLTYSYTSIYAWLNRLDVAVTVVGVHSSMTEFLDGNDPTAGEQIDLVALRPASDGEKLDAVALRRICNSVPCVVVFGSSLHHDSILEYLDTGVSAFITEDRRRLGHAVVMLRTASELVELLAVGAPVAVQSPGLTSREAEVLVAWCHAATKEDAAERLAIEPATVSSHLQRIRAKYAAVGRSASTKAALIARAIQDGLVSIHEL